MSQIGMRVRRLYFDTRIVESAAERGVRKVLNKFGAYVRRTARGSIRKSRNISKPGEPPKSHAGHLRRTIFFGFDPNRRSVVIGPTPYPSRKVKQWPMGLEALEYGGIVRRRHRRGRGVRRVRYRARPFMGPALLGNLPKLPEMWQNSIV